MATKTKVEKRLKEIIEVCEKEILSSEIVIPFYTKEVESAPNDGEKAKINMKLKQIQDSLDFNKRFLDYLNNY